MKEPPFSKGSQIYRIFQLLADGEWHCGKHEMPGTQPAKPIQIIRQHGYEIENKTIACDVCGGRIVHRRLISTDPSSDSIIRSLLPESLKRRVRMIYDNVEAVTQRKGEVQLEVDHRFPQVRWSSPEEFNDPNMPEAQIRRKFQLLTRSHNLWKSRYCEECVRTGKRGTFIGIQYFYQGGPNWPDDIPPDDERGCYGCFWFNPDEWRKHLNRLVAKDLEES